MQTNTGRMSPSLLVPAAGKTQGRKYVGFKGFDVQVTTHCHTVIALCGYVLGIRHKLDTITMTMKMSTLHLPARICMKEPGNSYRQQLPRIYSVRIDLLSCICFFYITLWNTYCKLLIRYVRDCWILRYEADKSRQVHTCLRWSRESELNLRPRSGQRFSTGWRHKARRWQSQGSTKHFHDTQLCYIIQGDVRWLLVLKTWCGRSKVICGKRRYRIVPYRSTLSNRCTPFFFFFLERGRFAKPLL